MSKEDQVGCGFVSSLFEGVDDCIEWEYRVLREIGWDCRRASFCLDVSVPGVVPLFLMYVTTGEGRFHRSFYFLFDGEKWGGIGGWPDFVKFGGSYADMLNAIFGDRIPSVSGVDNRLSPIKLCLRGWLGLLAIV